MNAENIPDYNGVTPLDFMMPGVQVTTGLGFFLHSITKVWVKLIYSSNFPSIGLDIDFPSGIVYDAYMPGVDPRRFLGVSRPPLQKYIKEAKRMMYWYINTKMHYFLK